MVSFDVEVNVVEGGLVREGFGSMTSNVTLQDLLAYTKSQLIFIAGDVLAEEQAAGFDQNPLVLVDGQTGKQIANVSPLGSIEYVARADMGDVILDTYQSILDQSPVVTGAYKSANYVFLNKDAIAGDMATLTAWVNSNPVFNDTDFIYFINVAPYARKLENLGVTSSRQQSRTVSKDHRRVKGGARVVVPNGTYYVVARSIRSKYKNNSTIKFNFVSGSSFALTGNFASKGGKPGRTYLYPSIAISAKQGGTF